MSDLFWPGDERAGALMSDQAWLEAMVSVEQAWLDTLAEAGIAPASTPLTGLVGPDDVPDLAADAEAGGNPVIGLVALLRERADGPAAEWIHRGLTSQDVVDTGLVLCLRDVVSHVREELGAQCSILAELAETHRHTLMAGRTLTQHAVPTTFGLLAATWLDGVLDATDRLAGVRFPVQAGGAAGTLSAVTELADAPALDLTTALADRLSLVAASPWHTSRGAVTAIGDALVACTDGWGRIANDVITLSRPEIGELTEGAPGGSSTMPHKQNPVASILIRRAALANPPLASTLHLTAAGAEDQRSAGGWHTEWATLRDLGRRTAVAATQTTELLRRLRVHPDRMEQTARAAWADLTAERAAIADLTGRPPSTDDYLGATDALIDRALERARTRMEAR